MEGKAETFAENAVGMEQRGIESMLKKTLGYLNTENHGIYNGKIKENSRILFKIFSIPFC